MHKAELTQRIAKRSKLTPAAAADQLDRLVEEILERVRKGRRTVLPGLGTFNPSPLPGQDAGFVFEPSKPKRTPRG